ncbi:hypothetical protein [Planomicrobium sp. CPCC 101079]|nr:hypothetical protein [Planomicrobium sp. CPCC 101079]
MAEVHEEHLSIHDKTPVVHAENAALHVKSKKLHEADFSIPIFSL